MSESGRQESARAAATWRRLASYLKPHWLVLLVSMLAMVFEALTQVGFAALIQPLVDEGFVESDRAVALWWPAAIVGLFVVRGLAGFCSTYGMNFIARRIVETMRVEVFGKYLTLPSRHFDQSSGGDLVSRITFNIEQVAFACTGAIIVLVRDSLLLVGLVTWMFWQSPMLTMTFLVIGPLIGVIILAVNRRFRRISRSIQNSMGDVTGYTGQAVEGHRVIKVFAGQTFENQRFAEASRRNRQQHLKLVATSSISTALVEFLGAIALAVIVYIAISPQLGDQISAGQFMSFFTAMMLMFPAMKRMTKVHSILQRGVTAAESVFEILDEASEPNQGNQRIERARGDLLFDGVGLTYQSDKGPVLKGVSFQARPNSVTAIVGRSGSGKTSLVSLLPRFYELDEGRILLDGQDIRELDLVNLRRQLALVSQDVVLFNDSIANNIAYGEMAGAPREAVIQAARDASALDFIESLPQGFDTVIGDRGVLLSGGQRQRLGIARALLKDAPVLILDEATSALDTESERAIQQALERLMRNRTTLVIAHRLSTVENADQIIALDAGRVVEIGRHQQLLDAGGYYAQLYRMQLT